MDESTALAYVDVIVETLVQQGVISPERYGRMTENERHELAEKLQAKADE